MCCRVVSRHILSKLCFSPLRDDRELESQFSRHPPPNVSLQKHDRRPLQIAGRRVHDAVVNFVERSVYVRENEITTRLKSTIFFRISQADVGHDRREKSILSGILESSKQNPPNWAQRRPSRFGWDIWAFQTFGLTMSPVGKRPIPHVVCTSKPSQCKRCFSIILNVMLYRTPAKLLISVETRRSFYFQLSVPNATIPTPFPAPPEA